MVMVCVRVAVVARPLVDFVSLYVACLNPFLQANSTHMHHVCPHLPCHPSIITTVHPLSLPLPTHTIYLVNANNRKMSLSPPPSRSMFVSHPLTCVSASPHLFHIPPSQTHTPLPLVHGLPREHQLRGRLSFWHRQHTRPGEKRMTGGGDVWITGE